MFLLQWSNKSRMANQKLEIAAHRSQKIQILSRRRPRNHFPDKACKLSPITINPVQG